MQINGFEEPTLIVTFNSKIKFIYFRRFAEADKLGKFPAPKGFSVALFFVSGLIN